jgi:hypothetical protein
MRRYAMIGIGVIGMLGLAACGAATPPRTLPATLDAGALPSAARQALDTVWPKGWSMASIGPQVSSCLAGKPAATIITSDFDSDGLPDIAAAVKTPKGVRLVVLLARSDHYALFDVDGLGDEGATAGLGLGKRGDAFTKAASLFQDFYPADTLTAITCAGPVASYLWSGLDFYKVPLAPGARPSEADVHHGR